jgi:hypothetical protein
MPIIESRYLKKSWERAKVKFSTMVCKKKYRLHNNIYVVKFDGLACVGTVVNAVPVHFLYIC